MAKTIGMGVKPKTDADESKELKDLKKENASLKKELKGAQAEIAALKVEQEKKGE